MIEDDIKDFYEYYKNMEKFPNFENQPISFKYYIKLWNYYRKRNRSLEKKEITERVDIKV